MQRYQVEKPNRQFFGWRFNNKSRSVPRNKTLRITLLNFAMVHWSVDGWKTAHNTNARDTGMDTYVLDVLTTSLPVGSKVVFTFYWPQENRWEGTDFLVVVE